jgi:hypothetical protein
MMWRVSCLFSVGTNAVSRLKTHGLTFLK